MRYSAPILLLAELLVLFSCSASQAAPITRTFVVDSDLSSYTVAGSFTDEFDNSFPLVEQRPGSLTAQVTGTLTVEYELGGSLTFLGGSIRSLDQSGPFEPSTSPAAIAYQASTPDGTFLAAQRDFDVPLTGSGDLGTDGIFAADSFVLAFSAGRIDYALPGSAGQSSLLVSGATLTNRAPGTGFLDEDAVGGPRLVIPIFGDPTFDLSGNEVLGQFEGTIVAVAVPEPSTLALIGVGAVLLCGSQLRRRVFSPDRS